MFGSGLKGVVVLLAVAIHVDDAVCQTGKKASGVLSERAILLLQLFALSD